MRKFMVSLLAAGLLLGTVASSRALTWRVDTEFTNAGDWIFTGVTSDAAVYTNILSGGLNTVNTPSTISFGTTFTLGGVPGPSSDTYTNTPTSFVVDLQQVVGGVGVGPTERILVEGNVRESDTVAVGTMSVDAAGIGRSTAAFVTSKLTDAGPDAIFGTGDDVVSLLTGDDPTGTLSNFILSNIGGITVTLFVEHLNALTPPGFGTPPLAIGGYITDVPEPGTLALLIGCGVGGSLFLRRRRVK